MKKGIIISTIITALIIITFACQQDSIVGVILGPDIDTSIISSHENPGPFELTTIGESLASDFEYPSDSPLEFQWYDCNQDTFSLIYPGQYDILKFNEWNTYDYIGQIDSALYQFYHPLDNCFLMIDDLVRYIEICKIKETQ